MSGGSAAGGVQRAKVSVSDEATVLSTLRSEPPEEPATAESCFQNTFKALTSCRNAALRLKRKGSAKIQKLKKNGRKIGRRSGFATPVSALNTTRGMTNPQNLFLHGRFLSQKSPQQHTVTRDCCTSAHVNKMN